MMNVHAMTSGNETVTMSVAPLEMTTAEAEVGEAAAEVEEAVVVDGAKVLMTDVPLPLKTLFLCLSENERPRDGTYML